MKQKSLPSEFHNEIIRLYVDELLTTREIHVWLKENNVDTTRNHIRNLLKQQNVIRKNNKVVKQRSCNHCNSNFTPDGFIQKFCKICCPTHQSRSRLQKYGLGNIEFEELRSKQKNSCAICNLTFELDGCQKIQIDHCHVTMKVRGLLCQRCNMMLAFFEQVESTKLLNFLQRVSFYLQCDGTNGIMTYKQIFESYVT